MKKLILSLLITTTLSACGQSPENRFKEQCVGRLVAEQNYPKHQSKLVCECVYNVIKKQMTDKEINQVVDLNDALVRDPMLETRLTKEERALAMKYAGAGMAAMIYCGLDK